MLLAVVGRWEGGNVVHDCHLPKQVQRDCKRVPGLNQPLWPQLERLQCKPTTVVSPLLPRAFCSRSLHLPAPRRPGEGWQGGLPAQRLLPVRVARVHAWATPARLA